MSSEFIFRNGKNNYEVRKDFPILGKKLNGAGSGELLLRYFDSAATSQKPLSVIEAEGVFYRESNANVHRAIHSLGEEATAIYEKSREEIRGFINAAKASEIVFTRNTTESINLTAASLGSLFKEGDEIILTEMEHHSNLVPWQLLSERTGVVLKYIPVDEYGLLDMDAYRKLLNEKTVLVSFTHTSNVLGTVNPAKEIIREAHSAGALVLVDGAQGVPHKKVDVAELGCDLFTFSGHKMYGPMGIGVLYGREDLLDSMPPYMGGGEMILSVTLEKSTWNNLPWKFEAGTPNVAGAAALAESARYLNGLGLDRVSEYEALLTDYGLKLFGDLEDTRLYGPSENRAGVFSFTSTGIHPHDMAQFLDSRGIAVRAGHHCAQPLMKKLKIPAATRASLGVYNTTEEIDYLAEQIKEAGRYFRNGI